MKDPEIEGFVSLPRRARREIAGANKLDISSGRSVRGGHCGLGPHVVARGSRGRELRGIRQQDERTLDGLGGRHPWVRRVT